MREFEEKRFASSDGLHQCYYIVVRPDGEPKGILQIAHGMCEYIDRYRDFMSRLADNGYVVCGNDHIGHGRTVDSPAELGYFAPENGWQMVVNDMFRLTKLMKEEYPDTPYFLLGHSMGSFMARAYAVKHARACNGYIFMGTADGFESEVKNVTSKGFTKAEEIEDEIDKSLGGQSAQNMGKKLFNMLSGKEKTFGKAAITIMLTQAEAIKRVKGDQCTSKLLDAICFGKYNDRIKDAKTGYEWVSRDEEIVAKYSEDPLCNYRFTVNGYMNMASVLYYVSDDKWYSHLPKDIPMLLVAGTEDPVGSYGEGVKNVYNRMCEYCCDASMKLYEGARHELLNELNKEEVYADILTFLDSNL
ncbi:Lysophospholipase [Ruminococcus sp. YE71]|uniref:alpha/beta fold hydrolase n=1 Tax=unclassified Ruminococcus TaxID=2608920 RepID=UPI00088FB37D|nr:MULTISPECIES: alpha/beta hydrolase [unclassified Ruminococcus]SDA21726.1 Lysophospholipase [Ruminococcus sp. YE78]SFW36794.1 Lysophospholipase [Ruminococcus sp. YE71]